ncbi:hypothetical protein C8Q75DRAFT_380378 [Abortiporus biennis]|nr:hypothetical protein C8Q75DRAFT_380378 [Abortiporus biennis]
MKERLQKEREARELKEKMEVSRQPNNELFLSLSAFYHPSISFQSIIFSSLQPFSSERRGAIDYRIVFVIVFLFWNSANLPFPPCRRKRGRKISWKKRLMKRLRRRKLKRKLHPRRRQKPSSSPPKLSWWRTRQKWRKTRRTSKRSRTTRTLILPLQAHRLAMSSLPNLSPGSTSPSSLRRAHLPDSLPVSMHVRAVVPRRTTKTLLQLHRQIRQLLPLPRSPPCRTSLRSPSRGDIWAGTVSTWRTPSYTSTCFNCMY